MNLIRQETSRSPAACLSTPCDWTGGAVGGAAWIVAQLEQGTDAFRLWLEQYVIATCSNGVGSFSKEDQAVGFPLPERPADATFLSPESEEYPTGSIVCQWWQEENECLGICTSIDSVMGLEHLRWYRLPQNAISCYAPPSPRGGADAE